MKGSEIKVSIVLLTYFHEKYLERMLQSIISQKFDARYEIIIADDCSKDNTINIIKEWQEKYPEIIYPILNQENQGICRNEYNGLMQCRGKYITISAGDDYWTDERRLEKQCAFLDKHLDYFADCTLMEFRYTDGTSTGRISLEEKYWDKEFPKEDYYKRKFFGDGGMLFRNVFEDAAARDKFSLLYKFSRDIEDIILDFFMFDYGKVHITDYVGYCQTVRRESDRNEHNYNSLYIGIKNIVNYLIVIHNIDCYYGHKICLKEWYKPYFGHLLYFIIKKHRFGAIRYLQYVPIKYIPGFLWDMVKGQRNKEI